jgi:hypothetical protein
MLIISFTPLEIPAIYGGGYINRISIPYRKGGVKTLSFLTGFTLLPIIPSSHFPISLTLGPPPIIWMPQMAMIPHFSPYSITYECHINTSALFLMANFQPVNSLFDIT